MKAEVKDEVCFLIDNFVKKHPDITKIMVMSDKSGVCDCLNLINDIYKVIQNPRDQYVKDIMKCWLETLEYDLEDEITPDTKFDEYVHDELDICDCLMRFERIYNIIVDDNRVTDLFSKDMQYFADHVMEWSTPNNH